MRWLKTIEEKSANKRRNRIAIFSVNVVFLPKYWSKIQIEISKITQNWPKKNILMETLSEKFKPIVLENCEFENRQNEQTKWTFSNVQPISIPI